MNVLFRHVGPEIVQQQEGIEKGHFVESEDPLEMHSCTFDRGLALQDLAYLSGHVVLLSCLFAAPGRLSV